MKLLIAILLASIISVGNSYASSLPDFPFILVNGESKVEVMPDNATMTITLLEFNKDSNLAIRTILEKSQYISSLAKDNRISSELVTFKPISKSETRSQGQRNEQLEILGYEVTQEVTVKFEKLENYSNFSEKVSSIDNVVSVITAFDSSKKDQINLNLVKSACDNAKEKAKNLSSGLGVKLGSVFAVTQDADFSSVSGVFEEQNRKLSYGSWSSSSNTKLQLIPKSITFNKAVSVIYKIEQ